VNSSLIANNSGQFPFSALLGQPALRQALLLAAIDPGIGGVLIEGPRGTAKSTSARALAELLPDGAFVTLPLGASEEQLVGTLNIEAALQHGSVRFAPGLLARAHGGVLYVDEVNLLPDALVDQLLDVAASGTNIVERDGVSHQHPASFVLVGTMNREEGELRPQLLDRFGLALALHNCNDIAQRSAIVKARLAFDADPAGFRAQHAAAQAALAADIREARTRLTQLSFDDAVHARVSELCIAAGVDGLRADLVLLRAARALAALQGAATLSTAHVDAVADYALHHRRNTPADAEPSQPANRDGADRETHTPNIDSDRDDSSEVDNWGALPAPSDGQLTTIEAVKTVRPLPRKKP
jgi:magnesium chelatase subunit I